MSIPDFVKTEWKSKGAAVIKFTDLNCNECQEKWNATSENYMNSSIEENCLHSKYVTCSMSIHNVWEYEYKDHVFKSKTAKNRKSFVLQKPTAVPYCLWETWKSFWNYYSKFFIDLDFACRFPYLVEENSHEWSQKVFKSYSYLKYHIEYYGDVPDILEQLSNSNSKTDEYFKTLDDIWFDLSEMRTYAELRLFFHVLEYPLNEEMKEFFSSKGITMDPSPLKKYSKLLDILHDENSAKVRKKISVAGHTFEFTPPAIQTCHTYTHKECTNMSEGTQSNGNPDDADYIGENVTVFSEDTEMETTLDMKQTNSRTNFSKAGMSLFDLNVKNKMEEHLEATDEKEDTDSFNVDDVQTKDDVVSDDDNRIKSNSKEKKKNSNCYVDIEQTLNQIQKKSADTSQLGDFFATISNHTPAVNIDSQMNSSAVECNYLNNEKKSKDNQECEKNCEIVKSYEDTSPVVEMSTNSEEYRKEEYEHINPEMKACSNYEKSEEAVKINCEQAYLEVNTTNEENKKTFKINYEQDIPEIDIYSRCDENDHILKNYEEKYPGINISSDFEENREIFKTNCAEVNSEADVHPIYEENEDAKYINENVTVFLKDSEMETSSDLKQTNSRTNFPNALMSHLDLDVKNKMKEQLEVTDEKENSDSINVNSVQINCETVSENDNKIKPISKKRKRNRRKNKKSNTRKDIASELNHAQQKSENSASLEGLIDSSISNDNTIVNSDSQLKSTEDTCSYIKEGNEENQKFDQNETTVCTNFVKVKNGNVTLLCKENEVEITSNKETNTRTDSDKKVIFDSELGVNSEKNLVTKNNIENHLEVAYKKENINPVIANNEANGGTISDSINETNCILNVKKRGRKKKKKSNTCKDIASELNHAQQKGENSTLLESLVESSVSNDNAVISNDTQLKSSEDTCSYLNTKEGNEDNQKIVCSNFEEVSNSNGNVTLLCKDNEMEVTSNKETNPGKDFDEKIEFNSDFNVSSEKNLDAKKNIEDHLEVADRKENITPDIVNIDEADSSTISDSNSGTNCTLNMKKRGGKKKKSSRSYMGIAWALSHIQQKCENTAQVEDFADSTISNGTAPINIDSQMELYTEESRNLINEKETSCEDAGTVIGMSTNSKNCIDNEFTLNCFQQDYEDTAQLKDFSDYPVSNGTAPVNIDYQMKLFVDKSSFLNNEKKIEDNQGCNKNKKIAKISYEDTSLAEEMPSNCDDHEKIKYMQINPEMNMDSNYEEREKIVKTNYEQVYPEVNTNYEENEVDFKENYMENNSEVDMHTNYEENENAFKVNYEEDNLEINIYPSFEENDEIFKSYEEKYPEVNMFNNFEEDKEIIETDYEEVCPEEEMYPNNEENEEESCNFTPNSCFEVSDFQSDHSAFSPANEQSTPWYASFSPSLWLENCARLFLRFGSKKDKISSPEDTVTKLGRRNIFSDWYMAALSMVISKIGFLFSLLGFNLNKKKMGDSVKRIEKKNLRVFSDVFNVKNVYNPNFSSESLHITKVKKSEDFRESYKNLIKIEVNATNNESGSFAEVNSYCMSEEDIDIEIEHLQEMDPCKRYHSENTTYPYMSQYNNEDDELASHSFNATPEYIQNLDVNISNVSKETNIENKSNNATVMEDWLYSSTVTFDENGDQILVPLTSNNSNTETNIENKSNNAVVMEDWLYSSTVTFDENGDQILVPVTFNNSSKAKLPEDTPLHEKIDKILKNYHLIRFSSEDEMKEKAPENLPKNLVKYWLQRYRLFLKFDEDIRLDNEAWFSVTPEMVAAHQAYRCSCDIVVDAFCGAGGNAIQLANTCHHVIAIDIDPEKIEIARHNARVYGVADRIEFIQGDFFQLAPSLKADAVLLSPPWGGIDYNKNNHYDVLTLGGSMNCKLVMDAARKISENIALYVPKSSNLFQIIELAGVNGKVDIEYNYISNKRKSITAYYGYLADYSEEKDLS